MKLLLLVIGCALGAIGGRPAHAQGQAAWLEQSTFIASSLETGPVGYVEAWGGSDFGYAYSYTLSGQPAGVTIDRDTGMLSIGARLSVGTHRFDVIVANRKTPTKVARFALILSIKQGVTANRTGDQILSKSYVVDSGTYGRPTGRDYTKVLQNIRAAILADQTAAGDGRLRATIYFRRGILYDYTDNGWAAGLQYLTIAPDPAVNPSGPRPRLRNIRSTYRFDSELAIFGTGAGSAFDLPVEKLKSVSPPIQSASPGQSSVRLRLSTDAAKIKPGRWYLIGSYDQQVGGFPPNIRYFDYVKVTSVSGTLITLDRKLRHHHQADNFELPSQPASLGVARIIPLDMGGSGGITPAVQGRFAERLTVRDIEFVKNPSTTNGSNVVVFIGGTLDASFENCILPRPVPSIVAHMRFFNGTIQSSEPDKIISILIFDRVTSGEVGGATGAEFFLIRNTKTAPINVSPRQLRVMSSTIDATKKAKLVYPVTWAFNGPILLAEFESTQFIVDPTNNDTRIMPGIQEAAILLGRDATWSGTTLIVPRTSDKFLEWQVWMFRRAVICGNPGCTSWGVVGSLTSPTGGASIRFGIGWKAGTKPATGRIFASRGYSLVIDGNSRLVGKASWDARSGGFVLESIPPSFGPSITGPYPPLDSSFE